MSIYLDNIKQLNINLALTLNFYASVSDIIDKSWPSEDWLLKWCAINYIKQSDNAWKMQKTIVIRAHSDLENVNIAETNEI